MKIPLFINNDGEQDGCSYSCMFRADKECNLFKQPLEKAGYYDSIYYKACDKCKQVQRFHCEEDEESS